MRTISLTCNRCGAPLQAPESTQFVTCSHCNTRLKIVSSGGTTYTEALKDILESQVAMAEDLEIIRLQNELERIDREWTNGLHRFEVTDAQGQRSLQREDVGIASMAQVALGAGAALFIAFKASEMGAPAVFTLGPLAMLVFTLIGFSRRYSAADRYRTEKSLYESRRERIKQAMVDRRSSSDAEGS